MSTDQRRTTVGCLRTDVGLVGERRPQHSAHLHDGSGPFVDDEEHEGVVGAEGPVGLTVVHVDLVVRRLRPARRRRIRIESLVKLQEHVMKDARHEQVTRAICNHDGQSYTSVKLDKFVSAQGL